MIIALWMEHFVVGKKDMDEDTDHHKVGAVLVLPNDIVCAADCSRDGVHAVARLLMKHYDKAEGSKMFMSRKPCPTCAKLLVQSKVKRVLFLPFEPEYYRFFRPPFSLKTLQDYKDSLTTQVDSLFTASVIAQTKFTLQVEKAVRKDIENDTPPELKQKVGEKKHDLKVRYGFVREPGWIEDIQTKLPWPAFDCMMKEQFTNYFGKVMEWIARVLVVRGRGSDYMFELVPSNQPSIFNPTIEGSIHEKQAQHFIEIARFLAERKDDPKTGVGAVIVSEDMEILSFGWNGFPLKAHYGEFGRASKKDQSQDKKYPYVIHAEQNALLMRNKQDIRDAILFVTKPPCNECAPLLAAEGIATVVVDDDVKHEDPPEMGELGYDKFPKMVGKGKFVCYQTIKTDAKGIPASDETKNKLNYDDSALSNVVSDEDPQATSEEQTAE